MENILILNMAEVFAVASVADVDLGVACDMLALKLEKGKSENWPVDLGKRAFFKNEFSDFLRKHYENLCSVWGEEHDGEAVTEYVKNHYNKEGF